MGICRLMVSAYLLNDGECQAPRDYGNGNLLEGISFARWRLSEGHQTFPHDTGINCRTFIKWAQHKRKEIDYRD